MVRIGNSQLPAISSRRIELESEYGIEFAFKHVLKFEAITFSSSNIRTQSRLNLSTQTNLKLIAMSSLTLSTASSLNLSTKSSLDLNTKALELEYEGA